MATLLALVGSETYLLLKSLLSPQLPSEFTFDEITSKLINNLKPRRLTVAERFKFHQRNQNDGDVAKLTSYTGQTIPVLGLLNVTTQYKGQSAQMPIVVVAG